nr:cytoskeleton-associated protein 4-like [Nerophis lumbriciformis]
MTAKKKSNAGEKAPTAAAPVQKEEKKPQKSNGVSSSAAAQAPARNSGKKSGGNSSSSSSSSNNSTSNRRSCLSTLCSVLFYAAMIGGAGLAAFHLQKVVEEIRQTSAKNSESAQISAELSGKMESVVQQVASLKGAMASLESSFGATRAEVEGALTRIARGEEETRRVEETLQKLQNDLLRELSEGMGEVKEARERDFSSLETTVEQRLEEVSRSVRASVAEFTEAQGEARNQLADLEARLGGIEDPAAVKLELAAIVDAVAEIKVAKQDADSMAASVREQIQKVREELQTRSQEVESISQEVESVRSLVQDTVGNLKLSVSGAEAQVQALGDRTGTLESGLERASEKARDMESKLNEVNAQTQKRVEDIEGRIRASEESSDSITAKVESLLSQLDTRESDLAGSGVSGKEMKALSENLAALKASVTVVEGVQDSLAAADSLTVGRLEGLERLAATAAEEHAAELEEQRQAIASMRAALGEYARTLAELSQGAAGQTQEE